MYLTDWDTKEIMNEHDARAVWCLGTSILSIQGMKIGYTLDYLMPMPLLHQIFPCEIKQSGDCDRNMNSQYI